MSCAERCRKVFGARAKRAEASPFFRLLRILGAGIADRDPRDVYSLSACFSSEAIETCPGLSLHGLPRREPKKLAGTALDSSDLECL